MAESGCAARGALVALGEGFDLASEPIPTEPGEVDAWWCLRFLRAIRDVAFATVDADGLPAVRVVDVMAVEPGRLFFLVPRGKALFADVLRSGAVAIVGQTPDLRMCRLRGRAVHPSDEAEQRRLVDMMFELNPSMNELYPGSARGIIDAFCIEDAVGEYYDLGQKPLLRVPYAIGGGSGGSGRTLGGRFEIGAGCRACGRCARACPASCIEPGEPFRIASEHCLGCGLCAEVCPSGAVGVADGS